MDRNNPGVAEKINKHYISVLQCLAPQQNEDEWRQRTKTSARAENVGIGGKYFVEAREGRRRSAEVM